MRGSSGKPGSRNDSDPAAMMQWSNVTDRLSPSSGTTSIVCASANVATPRSTVTLRCFASPASPVVRRPITLFFQSRSLPASILGAPNSMPCDAIARASSMTFAACSSALDGMQPTLRQTPPSIGQRSIRATLSPRSAARNAAV